jgi:hypothetical protein
MSRSSRVGIGLAIGSLALFGLVPAAQHAGLALDDQQVAIVLVAGAFLMVLGVVVTFGRPVSGPRSEPPPTKGNRS